MANYEDHILIMILNITQHNLCKILVPTKVEELLSYCQKHFSCVLQVYKKFTMSSILHIYMLMCITEISVTR